MPVTAGAVIPAANVVNQIAINGLAAIGGLTIVLALIYVGYILGRARIFDEDPNS